MFNKPDKLGEFSAELNGKELATTLSKVDKVVQYSDADKLFEDMQILVADGKYLSLVGRTADTICLHRIGATKQHGAISLSFASLRKLVDKKDAVSLTFDGRDLHIKAGRSKSSLTVKQVALMDLESVETDIKAALIKGKDSFDINKSDINKIMISANMLGIKDVFSNTRSVVCVEARDGSCDVVSHTAWSASATTFKSVGSHYKFATYTDMIQIIDALVDEEIHIYTTHQGYIVAKTDDFLASFPPAPVLDSDYEVFDNFVSGLGNPPCKFVVNGESLKTAVSDITALFIKKDDNPNGVIAVKDTKLRVNYSCDAGSKSEILDCKSKGNAEFKCDLRLLTTVLKALKKVDDVKIAVFGIVGQYKSLRFDTNADGMEVSFVLYIPQ
jgi:hypothetical protein